MAELKGSLGSLGLPAIVQLIGELRHSGNLHLTRNASRGVLGFDDGRLVTASYNVGELRGLRALAACTQELIDGDFVFVEGSPSGDRTLDLGGSELQKLFGRIVAGEDVADIQDPPSAAIVDSAASESCPLLGFVDDATRHYSRPTALHRCYAASSAALVSGHEQRDLCLSGRFPTCPRFRNASSTNTVPAAPPAPAPAWAAPAAVSAGAAQAPRQVVSARGVPAGVAARMEAAEQMRMATAPPTGAEPRSVARPPNDLAVARRAAVSVQPIPKSRRGPLLIAIAAGIGLLVLIGGVLLAFAARTGGGTQNPPNVAAQTSPEAGVRSIASVIVPTPAAGAAAKPVPGSSPVPVAASAAGRSGAAPAPAQSPLPAAPSAVPTVAVAGVAVAAPVPGQPLVDVRFASGPKPGWVDAPPYAVWSDGAYRLKAGQATHFVAIGAPVGDALSDVVVSGTFRKTGGPPGGGYGLVIRNQGADSLNGVNQNVRAYVMEAGDRGEFGIWRREGDHWVDLVPWTRTDGVRPGGSPNDLEVRAIGDQLTFSVNGAELASTQDDTWSSGGVGVFVGGDSNEVALDRFVAQVPD